MIKSALTAGRNIVDHKNVQTVCLFIAFQELHCHIRKSHDLNNHNVSFFLFCTGLSSEACMSLHLVSTMDTFYYSLLLFNLCTALGGTSALSSSFFVLCFAMHLLSK